MKSQQLPNNRETLINNLVMQLERNKTVSNWALTSNNKLYVNGQQVLVRTASDNTHMCVELYHEDNQARWVKSWGLDTPAKYTVLLMGDKCYWYSVDNLKTLISDGIVNNTLGLVNNSHATRSNNRPSSNVMNVWLPLLNKALLVYHTCEDTVDLDKYIINNNIK